MLKNNKRYNFLTKFIYFSYHEEDELTDDGEENEGADRVGILPHAESNKRSLEWDDSTLSPLASSSTNSNGVLLNNNNNTKSYCV